MEVYFIKFCSILLIMSILIINIILIRRNNSILTPFSIATFVILAKNIPYSIDYIFNGNSILIGQTILSTFFFLILFIAPFFYSFQNINLVNYKVNSTTKSIIIITLLFLTLCSLPLVYLFKYNIEQGWGMAYYNFKGFGLFHFCLLLSISISSILLVNRNYKLYIWQFTGFIIIYFLLIERITNTFLFIICITYLFSIFYPKKFTIKSQIYGFGALILTLILYKGVTSQGTGSFFMYLINDSDQLLLSAKFISNSDLGFTSNETIGYLLKTYIPFSDRINYFNQYRSLFDERLAEIMSYSTSTQGGIAVPANTLSIKLIGYPSTCMLILLSGLWMNYLNSYVIKEFNTIRIKKNDFYISPIAGIFFYSFQQVAGTTAYEATSYFLVIFFSIIFFFVNKLTGIFIARK